MRPSPRGSWIWVLGIVLLLPALVVAQRPRFDPQRDYGYDLAATEAAVADVVLDGTGFAWPSGAGGDTVFLEISLAGTTGAAPAVTVERGELRVRQVFEEGSQGRRLVDVSPLARTAGTRVTLRGDGVAWREGSARVFSYSNPPLDGRRVLVLAPHPDDAEIAAFSVYRRSRADIVTITAGDSGWQNFKALYPETVEHYRIKGMLRTWNSITVPMIGGVPPDRARNLGYYNGRLAEMQKAPDASPAPFRTTLDDPAYYRRMNVDPALRDRPFVGTWQAFVDDLVWELERVRPDVIITPHPFLDSHLEHQLTTVALAEALARWAGECEIYLYTNHAMENESWPLGDRDAMSGLPPWTAGELYYRRLHSHPVTPEEQKLKLLALEAMHDLRAFDLRDGTDPLDEAKKRALQRNDYYRRAPRPNEIFFVTNRAELARLRNAWLERATGSRLQ